MTLPQKVITRLENIADEIVTKITSYITAHNSSSTAHNDIRENYVKVTDKSKHPHGQLTQDGKITTTTNSVSKVVVTESDGTLKTIAKIPENNVIHQDISGKLNKNQGANNSGKVMKVQSSGDIEPEEITIPTIDVQQTKQNGVEIGSINGITFYCNENTTYNEATISASGLMSSSDKAKLNGINDGADSVSFNRILNSGTKIGTLSINNQNIDLYCTNSSQYGEATPDHAGLMSSNDKIKLDGIANLSDNVTFERTLSSGTKIGTLTIDGDQTDLYCSTPTTYTASNGIVLVNNQFKHSNSVAQKTTSNLYKIKHDAYGHITESAPVTQSDISDLGIATSNHSHSGWTQIQMDPGERGVLYVNEQIKLAVFQWTGGASTGAITKGSNSINTIPEPYRPRSRISTHINIDSTKPIVVYIKGRTEASEPGQVWCATSQPSGNYYFACNLMWTYGF